MLTNDSWDLASYHQRDLMAEADSERLVAMLPRRAASMRQRLARACYRFASWLDGASISSAAGSHALDLGEIGAGRRGSGAAGSSGRPGLG